MVSLSRIFCFFNFKDPAVQVDLRPSPVLSLALPSSLVTAHPPRLSSVSGQPSWQGLEKKRRYGALGFHHSLVSVLMLPPHLHPPPHPSLASSSSPLTSHSAALLAKADILLLDEPTNHLDLHAVLWLEAFLTRGGVGKAGEVATPKCPGTIVLVSHDRCFVENVATDVIVFEVCFFANRGILDKVLCCFFRSTF